MPSRFDGEWLRDNLPDAARSMERFIDKIKQETHGEVIGDLGIIRIPLNLYRARNVTSLQCATDGSGNHPFAASGGHAASVAQRSECSSTNRSNFTAFEGHKNAVACKQPMSFLRHVSRAPSPIGYLHERVNAGKSGHLWAPCFH